MYLLSSVKQKWTVISQNEKIHNFQHQFYSEWVFLIHANKRMNNPSSWAGAARCQKNSNTDNSNNNNNQPATSFNKQLLYGRPCSKHVYF